MMSYLFTKYNHKRIAFKYYLLNSQKINILNVNEIINNYEGHQITSTYSYSQKVRPQHQTIYNRTHGSKNISEEETEKV